MCFDIDSYPPIKKISGASVLHQDLVLSSKDGTEFAAFYAESSEPKGPAVIILPDVRGLYSFYEELALRFSENGYDAIAIDYFGRTAGINKRDDNFEFMPHVAQTKVQQVTEDVTAAINSVMKRPNYENRNIFTVGFCFGGSSSWLQAAGQKRISGAIGFYGHPSRDNRDGTRGPIYRVEEFNAPILALMGGADKGIPIEEVNNFRIALDKATIDNEVIIYDNAPHSFFDRKFDDFQSESEDAWKKILNFIMKNS
ncbi:MAG: dienelactone hydrolase family protein [Dehalococcoidia bacterium]|jgi:carboxymethylenebutenolidase|nr:MAG: carboxymethylenebutenolidase [Chloroflexota bacterium]